MSAARAFRSLRSFNYRVWVAGAFISNVGTWVQRMAQDWLVLTQLTHNDASAVGVWSWRSSSARSFSCCP